MPPKKDDKKGKKGVLKEVDPSEYVRPSVEIDSSLLQEGAKSSLSGKIANIESLFPEWTDLDSEVRISLALLNII